MHETQAFQTKFECEICHKTYKTKYHLQRHSDLAHVNNTMVNCALCNKTYPDKYHLKNHFRKVHDKEIFQSETKKGESKGLDKSKDTNKVSLNKETLEFVEIEIVKNIDDDAQQIYA